MRLRDEPQHCSVTVETPGLAHGGNLQSWLAVAIEEFITEAASGVLIRQLDHGRAVPLDVDNRYEAVRQDALYGGAACQVLKTGHSVTMPSAT